jgi:hypothetical protein
MNKLKFLFIFLSISTIFILGNTVNAYDCTCANGSVVTVDTPSQCGEAVCAATTDGGGSTGGGSVSLDNPLPGGNEPNVNTIIGQIISGVLGVVGSLALVMFIYGGLTWMLAAGSPQRVQKGRDILIWAVIGLVVVFSAYAMVKFLFTNIFLPTTTAPVTQTQEYRWL